MGNCAPEQVWQSPTGDSNRCQPDQTSVRNHPDWLQFTSQPVTQQAGGIVCLQAVTGLSSSLQKIHTTLARLTLDGSLRSYDSADQSPALSLSSDASNGLRFRLFVFSPETKGQEEKLCATVMKLPDYDCLADQRSTCLLYFEMHPKTGTDQENLSRSTKELTCEIVLRPWPKQESAEQTPEASSSTEKEAYDGGESAPPEVPETTDQPQRLPGQPLRATWVTTGGGDEDDQVYDVAWAPDGGVLITGAVSKAPIFGKQTPVTFGKKDLFVARLDAQGQVEWARLAGSLEDDRSYAIVADTQGNAYIAGSLGGDARFGTLSVSRSRTPPQLFVAKINAKGEWQWVKTPGGNNSGEAVDLAWGPKGHLYLSGYFSGTAQFGSSLETTKAGEPPRHFVASLTSEGTWRWSRSIPRQGITAEKIKYDKTGHIAISTQGEVYIMGGYWGSFTFGTTTLSTSSISAIYVAKLDANQNWAWVRSLGNQGASNGIAIAITRQNDVVVAGKYERTLRLGSFTLDKMSNQKSAFVAGLSQQGTWKWAKQVSSNEVPGIFHVALDAQDNVYVAGYLTTDTTFGNAKVTVPYRNSAFVAKLSAQRHWDWVSLGGGFPLGQSAPRFPSEFNRVTSIRIKPTGEILWGGMITRLFWGTTEASFTTKPPHWFVAKGTLP